MIEQYKTSSAARRSIRALLNIGVGLFSYVALNQAPVTAQPIGDYDLDGKADLAVGTVNNATKSSAFSLRLSSGFPASYSFPGVAESFVTGRWFGDGKTYPGIVSFVNANVPLEWRIKNPQGTETVFYFGLKNDVIPNIAYDLDGDGITDPVVVRKDVTHNRWFIALSAYGGSVLDLYFGLKSDRPFVGPDGNGGAKLYVLRESDYTWYSRTLFGTDEGPIQWGLPKDIPLAPQMIDGQLSLIVVRTAPSGRTAFIRRADGSSRTVALGSAVAEPFAGDFFGLGTTLGYFERNTNVAAVLLPDGNILPFAFGAGNGALVAPDGSSSGKSNSSFGACTNVVSISNLSSVLYKPINEHGGRGPTLIVKNPGERTGKKRIEVRDSNCNVIGALGLQATDGQYGARYYSRSGGSGHSHIQFRDLAVAATGSSRVLIEGKGKWILIENPVNRQGKL